jgi:predicted negative regulator of RcsB-dependent stress response
MPKAIKKRTDRRTQKDTGLGETVTDIRERIQERQSTLVYALLIFGLVIILVGGVVVYNRANASKAAELEYEGYKIFHGMAAIPYASPADRYKSALEKFKASYAAKKNTPVLLYMADCYYGLGNMDEAIKVLKELTGQQSDPKITSLAYYKMSMAYIAKGDINSALNTFNTLTSIKDAPLQDLALLESARTLEAAGRTEEAKSKYKELITKFPKSPLTAEAQSRLAGLK